MPSDQLETKTDTPIEFETKIPTTELSKDDDALITSTMLSTEIIDSEITDKEMKETTSPDDPHKLETTSTLSFDESTSKITTEKIDTPVTMPNISADTTDDVITATHLITSTESTKSNVTTETADSIFDIEVITEPSDESETDTETSVTTQEPVSETEIPDDEAYLQQCRLRGHLYKHNDVISYMDKCREQCICINGSIECVHKACPHQPPPYIAARCKITKTLDSCCPVYDCPTTTDKNCFHEGSILLDGMRAHTQEKCQDCYCTDGEIKCTKLKCGVPKKNCKPLFYNKDECCPTYYTCSEPSLPELAVSTDKPMHEDETTEKDVLIESSITEEPETIPEIITRESISEIILNLTTSSPTFTTEKVPVTKEEIMEILINLTTAIPTTTKASTSPKEETLPETLPEKVTELLINLTTSSPTFTEVPSESVSSTQKTTTETIDTGYLIPTKDNETERPFPPFPGIKHPQPAPGPGSCIFDGKIYSSAQQIPRDDPCDFCFCFRGDIICLQQTCPPPIPGCYEEAIRGFCCPRYECPVRQNIVNVTTTTPSPFPGFPPHQKTSRLAMCEIEGNYYPSGSMIESASSPCLECRCGADGFMKCMPLECHAQRKIYRHGYR